MKGWNLLAEVLGFLSGFLLLWPAIVHNAHLRAVGQYVANIQGSRLKLGEIFRQQPPPEPKAWTTADQWLLTAGAVTLVVSFCIKFFTTLLGP